VPQAVPEVRACARIVTKAGGGQGAAREVAELILRARGVWDDLVTQYLMERGDVEARSSRAR
jgi:3-deoxy-D-manno-octulosonate 8-phosphate phosphatase (KDO 8-P phosphatase)